MIRLIFVGLIFLSCGPVVEDHIDELGRSGEKRDAAIQELLLKPKRAVGPLLKALEKPHYSSGHPDIAEVLVSLMLRVDDPRLVAALGKHLTSHPNSKVRARIANRMGLLKRTELLDVLMKAVRDTVPEVSHEAFKALNILEKKLTDTQHQVLEETAKELARSPHEGVRLEAMLCLEEKVDEMLGKATQLVTKAQLSEAEELYEKTLAYAPQSWKARYHHARFYLDNEQVERGLDLMRQLGAVLDVSLLANPPEIDGRLDDDAWKEAGQTLLHFLGYRGGVFPADMDARVYIGYTVEALYIGVYNYDATPDSLRAERTQRDDMVWTEDSVEIFLDANQDRRSYVQFVISGIGTIFDAVHENGLRSQDASWTGDLKVGTHVGEDFWSLECQILFDQEWVSKPRVGDVWGVNFCRDFRDRSHSTQWVYTYGNYHQPDGFGFLIFK